MFFFVVVFSKLPLVGIVKRLFSGVNNRYSEVIVFSFSLSLGFPCMLVSAVSVFVNVKKNDFQNQ